MLEIITTVGINTFLFFIVSEILPGFEIKNKNSLFAVAVIYSILMTIAGLVLIPLTYVLSFFAWLLGLIPFVGTTLAGASLFFATFIVSFVITALVLVIVDQMTTKFKMRSNVVVCIGALLMASLSTLMTFLMSMVF